MNPNTSPFFAHRRDPEKVAFVLSGGSIRGSFEAGAIRRLIKQGIIPDIVCGVSVGAINSLKLAEINLHEDDRAALREDALDKANRVVELWTELASGRLKARDPEFFPSIFLNMLNSYIDDAGDLIHIPLRLGQRVEFMLMQLHAMFSMEPLRDLLAANTDLAAMRNSGVMLRIGVTDAKSGRFFNVSGPSPFLPEEFQNFGYIDAEPDLITGHDWLSRPIFGADRYLMDIREAVFASSIQPAFMDPTVIHLRETTPVFLPGDPIPLAAKLSAGPPAAVTRLRSMVSVREPHEILQLDGADLDRQIRRFFPDTEDIYEKSQIRREQKEAYEHNRILFDGGLRDTLPIRTAIRLGARKIYVITGDQLERGFWNYSVPHDMGSAPALQYGIRLLTSWWNDSARNDVVESVVQNEMLGWLYRLYQHLDDTPRDLLRQQFQEYWKARGPVLTRWLGGNGWPGGEQPADSDRAAPNDVFDDPGCQMYYIAPTRDLMGANDFETRSGILEAIEVGDQAARAPVEISFPAPAAARVPAD